MVLTCGRQNIPLRGHRDDGLLKDEEPPHNDGNFRSLTRLLLRHGSEPLISHIKGSSNNATYLSKTVKNEILDCACAVIRDRIRQTVNGRFFSVLADEMTDRAGREQLVIVFRYATQEEGRWCIREDPARVVDRLSEISASNSVVEDELEVKMTGNNIAKVIVKKKTKEVFDDVTKLVGCGFDGAAAMSSESVGAAAELRKVNDLCDYFHCAMHALNLCVAACGKQCDAQACLSIIQALTSFFGTSAKRTRALQQAIKEGAPEKTRTKLVTFCTTPFLERHDSILVLCDLLPTVVTCLVEMQSWYSPKTRSKAGQLLCSLRSSSFLVALFSLAAHSAEILPLSRALQAKGMDAATAMKALNACIRTVQSWRNEPDELFDNTMAKTEEAAKNLGVLLRPPRCPTKSSHRANAGDCSNATNFFRVNLFLPLLSGILQQLNASFGARQQLSLKLCGLLPAQLESWEVVKVTALRYRHFVNDERVLKAEHTTWLNMLKEVPQESRPESVVAALANCPQLLLPHISILLQILAALPVTTAEPERFFSSVGHMHPRRHVGRTAGGHLHVADVQAVPGSDSGHSAAGVLQETEKEKLCAVSGASRISALIIR